MGTKLYYCETMERAYNFKNGEKKIKELFGIPLDEKIQYIRVDSDVTILSCKKTYDRRKL